MHLAANAYPSLAASALAGALLWQGAGSMDHMLPLVSAWPCSVGSGPGSKARAEAAAATADVWLHWGRRQHVLHAPCLWLNGGPAGARAARGGQEVAVEVDEGGGEERGAGQVPGGAGTMKRGKVGRQAGGDRCQVVQAWVSQALEGQTARGGGGKWWGGQAARGGGQAS